MMRTLRDMNMSKFVAEDMPLFLSLIDDLFPGLRVDKSEAADVLASLEKARDRAGGPGPGQGPGAGSPRLGALRGKHAACEGCRHLLLWRLPEQASECRCFGGSLSLPALLRRSWRSAASRSTAPG
jgi:hypothetical protein